MLKSFFLIILLSVTVSTAMGTVSKDNISTRVYLRDSNIPLELVDPNIPWIYRDIMAGTQLKIIVDSNAAGDWSGGLFIPEEEFSLGYCDLYCREQDCQGSVLADAGEGSYVSPWDESPIHGYVLFADIYGMAGNWFVIDYNALSTGTCHAGLYDDNYSFDVPVYEMLFTQVPSREFNNDHIVNFGDFAIFGSYWGITDCTDPNDCRKVDFDGDQTIDINDLSLFVDFWLERTN